MGTELFTRLRLPVQNQRYLFGLEYSQEVIIIKFKDAFSVTSLNEEKQKVASERRERFLIAKNYSQEIFRIE